MRNKIVLRFIALALFSLLVVVVVQIATGSARLSASAQLPLDQATAVTRAIEEARLVGLQRQTPEKLVVKKMTLGEYNTLTEFTSGPAANDPKQPVWVVSMRGPIVWSGPGSGGGDKFDNITIALNADTGELVATLSGPPDQPLLLEAEARPQGPGPGPSPTEVKP